MGIKLSGMISGLDTDSLVKELMSAYSTKKDKLVKSKTKQEWKMDAWKDMNKNGKYYTPILSASVGEPVQAELGFNYIANPKNGTYKAGERFELSLVRYEDDAPSTVAWKFDGQTVRADSVNLTAGSHTVEAHLTYPDGSAEVIRLVINAE